MFLLLVGVLRVTLTDYTGPATPDVCRVVIGNDTSTIDGGTTTERLFIH